jgi:hypothetical protein
MHPATARRAGNDPNHLRAVDRPPPETLCGRTGPFNDRLAGSVRRFYYILAITGLGGLLYFGWSYHRVSTKVMITDRSWPRQFPYPDRWLLALNNWYDARYPAPRGTIKLHGELGRVRLTTAGTCAVATLVFGLGAMPIAVPHLRRLRRGRGFEVSRVMVADTDPASSLRADKGS